MATDTAIAFLEHAVKNNTNGSPVPLRVLDIAYFDTVALNLETPVAFKVEIDRRAGLKV